MNNKYGNDFKNNIMWNEEYPFIPEVTNDNGFTIHEGDIVDYYADYRKKFYALRVYKIYSKDFIWTRMYSPERKIVNYLVSSNKLQPYTSNSEIPPLEDFDNQGFNCFCHILTQIYARLYDDELTPPGERLFDEDLFNAKRQQEVDNIKNKIKNKY